MLEQLHQASSVGSARVGVRSINVRSSPGSPSVSVASAVRPDLPGAGSSTQRAPARAAGPSRSTWRRIWAARSSCPVES